MKIGSLVIPIKDYKEALKDGCIFTPFVPNPSTICTVLSVGDGTIELEEVFVSHPTAKVAFQKSSWRCIQPPNEINIDELMLTEELCY